MGTPLMQVFSPAEYAGHEQAWTPGLDARGILHFGGLGTVTSFDGFGFHQHPVNATTYIRGLALGLDGRLYVGGVDELGYLEQSPLGQRSFVSLLDKLPPARSHRTGRLHGRHLDRHQQRAGANLDRRGDHGHSDRSGDRFRLCHRCPASPRTALRCHHCRRGPLAAGRRKNSHQCRAQSPYGPTADCEEGDTALEPFTKAIIRLTA